MLQMSHCLYKEGTQNWVPSLYIQSYSLNVKVALQTQILHTEPNNAGAILREGNLV